MKIRFLVDRDLANGRRVLAGEKVTVSTADGEAYIQCGVAEAVAKPKAKEVKGNV